MQDNQPWHLKTKYEKYGQFSVGIYLCYDVPAHWAKVIASVFAETIRIVKRLLDHIGAHSIPLLGVADWPTFGCSFSILTWPTLYALLTVCLNRSLLSDITNELILFAHRCIISTIKFHKFFSNKHFFAYGNISLNIASFHATLVLALLQLHSIESSLVQRSHDFIQVMTRPRIAILF